MTSPQTLTVMESNALLDELVKRTRTKPENRRAIRNHLMGLLMLDAGLRVSEVVGLLITDLWLNGEARHSLLVREDIAKNKSTRIIPLSTRIRADINLHQKINWHRMADPTSGFAFYTELPNSHLTDRQAERIIGNAAQKAIGRWVHPHILRHTFASRLMRTCNIRVVQDLLGHKHVTSTQIYTHPNEDDKRKAIDAVEKGGD
ncbi:Tyrosine recombinase XerD [subsurface metagenome]